MDQKYLPSIERTKILIAFMFLMGAIFIVRLFYVQVIQHDYYQAEAIKEHTTKFTIPAKRGLIYARDGKEKFAKLVLNEPVYTVYADPRYIDDIDKVASALRRIAGGNLVNGFEKQLENKDLQYTVLAQQVSKKQAELIKKAELYGVGMQESEKRVYPEGDLAAQILGFVNNEDKGQYGIEGGLNDQLSGQDGQLKAVTDVYGIPLSIGEQNVQNPPKNGKNVVLSVDRNIQHKAEEVLKNGLKKVQAKIGSVLVMNPNTGKILAMANAPTYNPGDYRKVTNYDAFQNRVISGAYEPGSVVKPLTMATAMNEGKIEPNSTYVNTGSVQVADATIKNVLTSPLGTLTMTQVLEYSFNTGVVHVLKQLGGGEINTAGKTKLYQYFSDRFFLGRPTGIELAGEAEGNVIPPNDQYGGDVRYANMSFGQGMNTTMLQTAAAFSAAINGGVYYTPQIIDGYIKEDGNFKPTEPKVRRTDVVSRDTSSKLRSMLNQSRGASFLSDSDKPGYNFGGKTGTSQVYDPKTGLYSETETIGSYLGFGGRDTPQYVIIVRVDDAKTKLGYAGSVAAGPIFTELSNWMIDYMQIQPKG